MAGPVAAEVFRGRYGPTRTSCGSYGATEAPEADVRVLPGCSRLPVRPGSHGPAGHPASNPHTLAAALMKLFQHDT